MNNLPVEIFRGIMLDLNQDQKLTCLAVCKQWEYLIKNHCLFHTIRITSYRKLDALIRRVRSGDQERPCCEKLIFDCCSDVRILCIQELDRSLPSERFRMSPEHHFAAMSQFINSFDAGRMMLLLDRIQFRNIKTLVMTYALFDTKSVLEIITKTPLLTELGMKTWTLSTEFFEQLHEMRPSLTKLTVWTYWLLSDSSPRTLKPAPLMKSFHIEYIHILPGVSSSNHFLEHYICKKYTNLSDIRYVSKSDAYKRTRVFQQGVPPGGFLETGVDSLFRTLGPKLDNILIKTSKLPENIFEMMDNYNCRPTTISFLPYFKNTLLRSFLMSNQAHSLRKLVLSMIDLPMENLTALTNLEDLSIDFDNTTGNLEILLDKCPDSLNALTLSRVILEKTNMARQKPRLSRLSFYNCHFRNDVDQVLSFSLPQLKHLSLNFCIHDTESLYLPGVHLSSMQMVCRGSTGLENTSCIKVCAGLEMRYYSKSSGGNDWDYCPVFGQDPGYTIDKPSKPHIGWTSVFPHFTIYCSSVKDVYYSFCNNVL